MLQPNELKKPLKVGHGRFLTADLLKRFFAGFLPGEDKYRLLFWLLLETGMRIKECCAVQERDFADDYHTLNIVTCKSPRMRQVTLSKPLASFVKQWCEFNRRRFLNDYIFPMPNHRYYHVQPYNVRDFLSKKRQQLGLNTPIRTLNLSCANGYARSNIQHFYALCCHSFRRFYETQLCNLSGGNYMLIASIMKYDDPSIVRKYYDDSQAVKMQEQLASNYHNTVDVILKNKMAVPMLDRKQTTLTNQKNIWDKWASKK